MYDAVRSFHFASLPYVCFMSLSVRAPTQTLRYASGRALICLNTCGLLKRASLERKKSAGGRTCPLLRLLH
ncbi:hypothetical protein HMPREF7545_0623 [Selenomonas noxia ATCC 43541]|nr:hypothetical protein HMPREF7545_0623 [Selenomonas noxia ATCC 43541]